MRKKIMRVHRLLLLFLIPTIQVLTAQQSPPSPKGELKGKIVESEKGLPLEFATISVYSSDSALVGGGITAADGSFSIELSRGRYYALVRFISYENAIIENIEISGLDRVYDIGTIHLGSSTKQLNEVQVIADRSEMVINLDKKVFNVGKDLSSTGKSALDILDNIPSIAVDLDGNVSLRGSQNIQILVDGKPSGIVSAENTDALQNIQGSMIEHIEVITNPSARYEAEGMAGIINIVLKKEQQKGVNGSFETTLGYPENYSLGANVNFRREKINYFLNYNIRYRESTGRGNAYQHFMLADTGYFTLIDRERHRSGLSNQIRGGFDYFLNSKNTITASFLYSYENQLNTTNLVYDDFSESLTDPVSPDQLLIKTFREDREDETEKDIQASLVYEKLFNKPEHKLTLLAQYDSDSDIEKSDIEETVSESNSSLFQRSENGEKESNLLLQADYNRPFGDKGKFETGYRSEFRDILNPYQVEELDSLGSWYRLENYSNDFEYIENVHALYVQAGNTFDQFSLQLGLRTELSDVRTYLKETDKEEESLYVDFFPTLHSTYQFDPINSLQISYTRRIQRPHFRMLNPFHSFSDSRNIRTGNPYLKPEYTHSFETGYLMKRPVFNFYSGVYYRLTNSVVERVNILDSSGITYMVPINLSERNSFGIESNLTLNIKRWWTLSGDFNFFRSITKGEYEGQDLSADDYSWNTRINSRLKLPSNTDFQTIFFYRAPVETTQGLRKAFYMLNLAASQDVFKNKGTLTFNVQDVLNTRRFRMIIDKPDLYSENENRWSERSYMLTFVYRLNQKKKNGRESRGNEGMGGDEMEF